MPLDIASRPRQGHHAFHRRRQQVQQRLPMVARPGRFCHGNGGHAIKMRHHQTNGHRVGHHRKYPAGKNDARRFAASPNGQEPGDTASAAPIKNATPSGDYAP